MLQKGVKQPTPEFPTAGQLQAYGDLSFLYLRSRTFQQMPVNLFRRILQPPIDLGFFQVLRFEEVPRCSVTWAFLSPEVEAKLISGTMLDPQDWLSGPQMWLIHLVAPYGSTSVPGTVRWLRDNIPDDVPSIRYLRVDENSMLHRIVEVRRQKNGRPGAKLLDSADFVVAH